MLVGPSGNPSWLGLAIPSGIQKEGNFSPLPLMELVLVHMDHLLTLDEPRVFYLEEDTWRETPHNGDGRLV